MKKNDLETEKVYPPPPLNPQHSELFRKQSYFEYGKNLTRKILKKSELEIGNLKIK